MLPARSRAVRLACLLSLSVGALVWCGCGPSGEKPVGGATASASTNAPSTPSATTVGPEYSKLVGRWQRTDAEYILEIRSNDVATGRLDAAYLNPNPIHVARAEASMDSGKMKVFVELQDVGYPGCTYRLTYFPQTDQLYGVYFQAALGQSFDVEFERVR